MLQLVSLRFLSILSVFEFFFLKHFEALSHHCCRKSFYNHYFWTLLSFMVVMVSCSMHSLFSLSSIKFVAIIFPPLWKHACIQNIATHITVTLDCHVDLMDFTVYGTQTAPPLSVPTRALARIQKLGILWAMFEMPLIISAPQVESRSFDT